MPRPAAHAGPSARAAHAGPSARAAHAGPSGGRTAALFLLLYSVLRFLIEYLRVQDYVPLMLGPVMLTRGQLLTIPLFVVGVWLWHKTSSKSEV